MKNLLYILSIALVLSSCFKTEDKLDPYENEVESVKIESDYSQQKFYNLATKSIVSSNNWTIWDLKFYAQNGAYYVKLNDAANMKAYRTNTTEFESILSFNENWVSHVDDPKGNINDLALNLEFEQNGSDTLFTNKKVFVLMLGTDAAGVDIGYKKIVIDYFYNNNYHIRFANLDGSDEFSVDVPKKETLNFNYLSFKNEGKIVTVEPDRNTWDLLFSRYTDLTITNDLEDTISDYSVTGVVLNPYSTKAYRVEDENFENVNSFSIDENSLTNQLNIIGFDWKSYDLVNSVYAVRQDNYYIIKDGNSVYYKMNFVSFLDKETNERGTISFNYDAIK